MNDWDVVVRLCGAPNVGHLATIRKDGSPHVAPLWMSTHGQEIWINTSEGTAKLANLRRDPRVALSVDPGADPHLAVAIRGVVVGETHENADAHDDELWQAYEGTDAPHLPGDVRVIVRIEPVRILVLR
ncbi:MAG: PPOX class F420-dependent oxidoreductase [Actinomycetota bacterium]